MWRRISPEMQLQYFRALCDHSAHWRDVEIGLDSQEAAIALVSHLGQDRGTSNLLPMLTRFSLTCTPSVSDSQWDSYLLNTLRNSPNLQTLMIHNWQNTTLMFSERPPFLASIQNLVLYHSFSEGTWTWDMTSLMSFVQARPSLVSLDLSLESTIRFIWPSDGTVTLLPQLLSLKIGSGNLTAMADMVRGLSVPSLTSLELSMFGSVSGENEHHTSVFIDPFLRLLTSCFSTLKHLHTNFDNPYTDSRAKKLITSLPSLISLSIIEAYSLRDWTDIFELLTFKFDEGGRLMGRADQNITLRTLFVDVAENPIFINDSDDEAEYEEYIEALENMVRSRCTIPDNATSSDGKPVARLERFGIGQCMGDAFERGPISQSDIVKQCWPRLSEFVDPILNLLHRASIDGC